MPTKPLPQMNHDSAPFWEGCALGELRVQHCMTCGTHQLPPRARCVECGDTSLNWQAIDLQAEVHSFTVVHRAPSAAFQTDVPYVIALVDLVDRARLMVNVVDCDPELVQIGVSVVIGFDRRSDGHREVALPIARLSGNP